MSGQQVEDIYSIAYDLWKKIIFDIEEELPMKYEEFMSTIMKRLYDGLSKYYVTFIAETSLDMPPESIRFDEANILGGYIRTWSYEKGFQVLCRIGDKCRVMIAVVELLVMNIHAVVHGEIKELGSFVYGIWSRYVQDRGWIEMNELLGEELEVKL
jgi:hypothetical protein